MAITKSTPNHKKMHPEQNSDVDDTVTTAIAAAKEDNEHQRCENITINF